VESLQSAGVGVPSDGGRCSLGDIRGTVSAGRVEREGEVGDRVDEEGLERPVG